MKRYEGLFILNTAGREEGVKEAIDKITAEITSVGGTLETTQKMDKRTFARAADRRVTSGFYVNVIFRAPGQHLQTLRARFSMMEEVHQVLITVAAPQSAPAEA